MLSPTLPCITCNIAHDVYVLLLLYPSPVTGLVSQLCIKLNVGTEGGAVRYLCWPCCF